MVLVENNVNIDILKALNCDLELNLKSPPPSLPCFAGWVGEVKSNVAIAAAVTSFNAARIHMIKYKISQSIYYTDTDSIFVDQPLDENEIGKELGLMKDELDGCIIKKAVFLGIKQYGYYYYDKNNIKQEKSVFAGIEHNSLKFNEIEELFNNNIIQKYIPCRFYKSFKDLTITIKSVKITIKK
jgi:hypothetical protein